MRRVWTFVVLTPLVCIGALLFVAGAYHLMHLVIFGTWG